MEVVLSVVFHPRPYQGPVVETLTRRQDGKIKRHEDIAKTEKTVGARRLWRYCKRDPESGPPSVSSIGKDRIWVR